MRVTIGHREEVTGVAGHKRDYFVDCVVEFSEEEKAIIRARGLGSRAIEVPAATRLPSLASLYGTGSMRGGGILLIMVAIIGGIILSFAGHGDGITPMLFFLGIGLAIYGFWRGRQQELRIDQPDRLVTLSQLLLDPRFSVHAVDPAEAKLIDNDLRANLAGMKIAIRESAALTATQTFEL